MVTVSLRAPAGTTNVCGPTLMVPPSGPTTCDTESAASTGHDRSPVGPPRRLLAERLVGEKTVREASVQLAMRTATARRMLVFSRRIDVTVVVLTGGVTDDASARRSRLQGELRH
jgi:hypothetical protein